MADMDEMLLSSPDPLALSNENVPTPSPIKLRGPVISPRKPLGDASGNAQVQEFYISTPPSKRNRTSPTKLPSNHASTSPWRIRLTVQAEQVDDKAPRRRRASSPVKTLTERTTTITVPLKGGHDTPPADTKRPRGRPRKSLESPKKLSGTPRPKNDRRRRTIPEATEEDVDPASPARNLPQKKNARRPRKSTEPNLDDSQLPGGDSSIHTQTRHGMKSEDIMGKPPRVRSRGRRKEITPMKVDSDSDAVYDESTNVERDSSALPVVTSNTGADDILSGLDVTHTSTPQRQQLSRENIPLSRSSPADNQDISPPQEQADVDPTEEHQEYDTILESEGFSMVSVSSLASTSNQSRDPPKSYSEWNEQEHTPAIASSPSAPPEVQSDSLQSSSRHLDKPQQGTPKLARVVRAGIALQGVLSPKTGSQRLGSPFQELKRKSPSVEVNNRVSQNSGSPLNADSSTSKERLDNLFSGFGAGTRRELRAGLRLGEELAKRQRKASQDPNSSSNKDEDVFGLAASPSQSQLPLSDAQSSYNLIVPIPKEVVGKEVQHPSLLRNQLPTPEKSDSEADEDRMSWKESTPMKLEPVAVSSTPKASGNHEISPESSGIDHTMLAREAEWQREREAVSRQIEMANKSQVIVIDSDSSDDEDEKSEDEETTAELTKPAEVEANINDIWQAEAHSADSSRMPTFEDSDALPQADIVKPRRSKLPDTWRRNDQAIFSDHTESSDADLFWQPEQTQRRTRGSRKHAQERANVEVQQTQAPEMLVKAQQDKTEVDNDQPDESTGALIASQLHTVRIKDSSGKTTEKSQSPNVYPLKKSTSTNSKRRSQVLSQVQVKIVSRKSDTINKEDSVGGKPSSTSTSPNAVSIHDPRIAQEDTLHIDPVLLQPQQALPQKANQNPKPKAGPRPPLTLNPTDEPSSWFSYLTRPFIAPASDPASVPPATKADLLLSSDPERLSLYTPWTPAHKRALAPLYYSALLYPVGIFPFNPRSPAASYLGATVQTSGKWSRRITKTDCAVADAFMVVLEHRGYTPSSIKGEQIIDATVAARMCVEVWVSMCMRGEVLVDRAKGEKSGLRREGDRSWCRERDVDWEKCATGYFERKRVEFDGLPSWKERGVVWR